MYRAARESLIVTAKPRIKAILEGILFITTEAIYKKTKNTKTDENIRLARIILIFLSISTVLLIRVGQFFSFSNSANFRDRVKFKLQHYGSFPRRHVKYKVDFF